MLSAALERTCARAPLGYTAQLVSTRRLSDGTNITIRPVCPEDDAIVWAFISGLSRETAYNRLLGARNPTRDEIQRLARIDYEREMAFVALTSTGGETRLVGDARYVRAVDTTGAEFAIVVADAWQHQGIGSVLLDALLAHARARGIARFYGITLATNQAMQDLARKFGFVQRPYPNDATLRQVEKTLTLGVSAAVVDASAGHAGTAANDEWIASLA